MFWADDERRHSLDSYRNFRGSGSLIGGLAAPAIQRLYIRYLLESRVILE